MRRQLRDSSDLDRKHGLGDGLRQRDHKLRWGASVSSQPIKHPRVGIMIFRFPGTTLRGLVPVSMGQPLGVLVIRIARVSVLKRCLSERKQQSRYDAEMEYATHRYP
jgi:hypothetical protein